MTDSNRVSTGIATVNSQRTRSKSKVNVLNYMTPALYKRLSAIINMSFYKQSQLVELELELEAEESHLAEPDEFALIKLHVEPEHEVRKPKVEYDNWMIGYKLKPEPERIVWKSRLYSKEEVVSKNQTLVERTENRVDIALNKFCNWFHSVSDDKHSHVTEDYIKKLFSSGFEIHPAAHSIYIEPKQVFSIPHQVADKFNVPHLSTKNQKKKLMNLDEMVTGPILQPLPAANVAFGKCLPTALLQAKREIGHYMKSNFPDELRTDEYLFKGIEDLRSTKELVKHVYRLNKLEMEPLYLKNFNYKDDEKYVPLYKKLGNKM